METSSIIDRSINLMRDYSITHKEIIDASIYSQAQFIAICEEKSDLFFRDFIIHDMLMAQPKDGLHITSSAGYCDVCKKEGSFKLENIWGATTEGAGCSICGLNMRLRYLFAKFCELYRLGMKVYISEQVTPFYGILKKFIPDLIGSEFDPNHELPGIRHEDSTHLSFDDCSFDMVLSNDVLEHVFDYQAAFSEAYRVLKLGGIFLFHVPFYPNKATTTVRAKLKDNGEISLLGPEIFHGNPISNQGSLLINEFGWDILDNLRNQGFADVHIKMGRDFEKGYLGNLCFAFYAKKLP